MEDIKIIKQEVHGGEDIKPHTLVLIWKQSIGRMCGIGADLAVLSGLESWGYISQLIKFLWASGRLLPWRRQTATRIPNAPKRLWLGINILKSTGMFLSL